VRLLAALLLLFSAHLQATEKLPWFIGFEALKSNDTTPKVLVLLFSQPDCHYCDQVRTDFLLPLQHQQRPELAIRELKIPGSGDVLDPLNERLSADAFARRYAISFFPSVLMLSMQGDALAAPLIGISSPDFYGYYLDQAIEQALAATAQ